MGSTVYEYRIRLAGERTEVFRYELDEHAADLVGKAPSDRPDWTELAYRQCPHCPLSTDEHSHCPLALRLHELVSRFEGTRSIDEVEILVRTPERSIRQKAVLQNVLASILDLMIPVCGCPVTEVMKPLARFHLPLASEEETIFRVTGMYLLACYFQDREAGGMERALDGLARIYEQLHKLNKAVAQRLQHATSSDSVKNAIALIDMYSLLIPVLLEDQLVELRRFFTGSLPQEVLAGEVGTTHLESAKAFRRDTASGKEGDDGKERPAWMLPLAYGAATIAERAAQQRSVEELLKKADSFDLEPIEEEKPRKDEGSGRAVYKLPDD